MGWKRKLKTVFYKLILSYIVLIVMTTAFVGSASYYYFSKKFNEQVENVNHRLLSYLGQRIETQVIAKAEEAYREITFEDPASSAALFLFGHRLSGHHAVVSEAHRQLRDIVAVNQDVMHSIHVYYAKEDYVLSSLSGLTYMDGNASIDLEWLDRARASPPGPFWIETRKVSASIFSDSFATDLITYVRPYPYTTKASNIQGYVAINLKESALRSMVSSTDPDNGSDFFLVSGAGHLFTHSDPAALHESLPGRDGIVDSILRAKRRTDNFIVPVGGDRTMVSYITMPELGWKLVNMTPVSEYYKSIVPIRNSLIFVCVAAVLIGILVSRIVTNRMYTPFRPILRMAHTLSGHQLQQEPHANEFKIINHVITDLSDKVSTLENTLQRNKPFIKHNLVAGLLYHTIVTEGDLQGRLHLLQLELSGSMRAITFHLDPQRLLELPIESSQFIKYDLIKHIESKSEPGRLMLAIELSERDICAVVCTQDRELEPIVRLAEGIDAYVQAQFRMPMTTVIGLAVDSPLQLSRSFHQTQLLLKYRFFVSEPILCGERLSNRERSLTNVPNEAIGRIAGALLAQDRERVREAWGDLKRMLVEGDVSADQGLQACRDVIAALRRAMEEIHLPAESAIAPELLNDAVPIRHISEYETLLLRSVDTAIEWIEQRSQKRSSETVQAVKSYIEDNIAAPLSLESIAERVRISPSYLSKLFKEEVGSNLTDYVTKTRIRRSCELILTTELTIEQIALKVGFNSSAYYIRKFKEAYGITPRAYKHNYVLKSENAN